MNQHLPLCLFFCTRLCPSFRVCWHFFLTFNSCALCFERCSSSELTSLSSPSSCTFAARLQYAVRQGRNGDKINIGRLCLSLDNHLFSPPLLHQITATLTTEKHLPDTACGPLPFETGAVCFHKAEIKSEDHRGGRLSGLSVIRFPVKPSMSLPRFGRRIKSFGL